MPQTPQQGLVSDDVGADSCARFSDEARRAIYDVIAMRRDVRHFREDVDVDEETLMRVLGAAHLAPSVGFSQPWGFVIVRDRALRARVRDSFLRCRAAEAVRFPPGRRSQYLSFRLEGILQAPLNVCVTVDLRPRGEAILGTTAQPEAVRASAYCAVENLWLAARAEGLGVGWVSIVEPAVLRAAFELPAGVEPIAYLCVGVPVAFRARPMLEEAGWRGRRPLEELVHRERWCDHAPESAPAPASESAPAPAPASAHPRARARDPERDMPVFDERARAAALRHQDELTKPRGSLGRLEEIAAWYCGATGQFPCEPPENACVAVFAADHGVVVEAVSAYGSQVTADMVCNMMAGGAAINVLARHHRVKLALVDVGVAGDLSAAPVRPQVELTRACVRAGTRNLRREPALTRSEVERAMHVGKRVLDEFADGGARLVAAGEVGIGNTTAGAALVCAMTGAAPVDVVGHGTGIDDATRARKVEVVQDALRLHAPDPRDPVGVLAAVGGLELAATVGFLLRAVERRVPIVLDGFLAVASALVARALRPEVARFLIASHDSAEQ
ncbi:MAG TPA: 5,6-dimethylbenzimidazole synthase, partial [Polyangiaceae bacterium]|nr:5,6-dimethylbenzimidazole synthase [Polyangiaceae bacterium]